MLKKSQIIISEINLLDLIKIILKEKFKIILITLIFTIISIQYASKQNTLYSFSTNITESQSSLFDVYNRFAYGDLPNVNANSIFELFIYNSINHLEISKYLENDPVIKAKLAGLDNISRKRELLNYAKSFKIVIPVKRPDQKRSMNVSFKWHNVNEGIELLNNLTYLNLENTRNNIINQIKDSSELINLQASNDLKNLQLQSEDILEMQNINKNSRIKTLQEQYVMAKELEIENPVYLRGAGFTYPTGYFLGYKAIMKEIMVLNARTNDEFIIMSDEFNTIQAKKNRIENSLVLSSVKLKQKIEILKNSDLNYWLNYNKLNTSVISLNVEPRKIIALGFILGLIIGLLYVIFCNLVLTIKK